ncbi:hypothetical protein GIB67_034912 [Kingdonia uniflora]|uniref:Uncharacterized protein n=1 Tax=Kingdonia uniflora TaxID=39325 RepID=A0A7J7NGJ2_9MAGN|nr:hypothetical protein GIB67_034912 [Kingdonia uniflora]
MEPELGPKLGIQYISEVKRVLKLRGKFVCLTLAESHVIAVGYDTVASCSGVVESGSGTVVVERLVSLFCLLASMIPSSVQLVSEGFVDSIVVLLGFGSLGLLFSKFRVGWLTSIHAVPSKPSTKPSFRTFMVVVEKERSTFLHQIALSFSQSSLDCDENQARGLFQAFENENKIRGDCSLDSDILYSFKDLNLGAKGDLKDLIPGRRLQFNLGEEENPHFSYKAVLLDAQQKDDPFVYNCGVFLVPTARSHEWLFSSEEGQWVVTESSKAARLIMVFLDEGHTQARMDDIQKYLSPLVKRLAPEKYDDGTQIPFMMASDGVKQREIVHQVTSTMTGPIVVEDVIYENVDSAISGLIPSKDLTFRRLTFQRSLGLVQSECLLTREESECLLTREDSSQNLIGEKERRKTNSSSKSKRKGSQRSKSSVSSIDGSRNILKANHQYLASSYHTGIISGFILAASNLESLASSGLRAKTAIIGLGAGLLPMFLRQCMPCLDIEVVELDPIILNLARDYFSFTEDEQMKVASIHMAMPDSFFCDIIEGMNIVSYEFVACQSSKKGVLILNEFAGAAQSLGTGAIFVNPWTITEVASSIGFALNMSADEREKRHRHNFMHVTTHTAQEWTETSVSELNDMIVEDQLRTRQVTPILPLKVAVERYLLSRNRLLILEFNATLTELVDTPGRICHDQIKDMELKLHPELKEPLRNLSNDPKTTIIILSGYDRSVLDDNFGEYNMTGVLPYLARVVRDYAVGIIEGTFSVVAFTEYIFNDPSRVHVADGIQFVREIANATECPARTRTCEHDSNDVISKENVLTTNGNVHDIHGKQATKIDILIIDADSADSSSGMTCPPEDFVAESFLLSVKQSLSEKGLFVINLVSRSPAIKDIVVSRMKAVFSQLFCLQIEEDVNEVLFALPSDNSVKEDNFAEATLKIQQLLKFTEVERIQNILDSTKNISRLK